MITGTVIGNVWATRKDVRLDGLRLLIIEPIDYANTGRTVATIVAADPIGAGIGEIVLVVSGSSARAAVGDTSLPVDATVVGIVDGVELGK